MTARSPARSGTCAPASTRSRCSCRALHDWDLETYWQAEHPAQAAYRSPWSRAYGTTPDRLRTAIDGCGVETYAFRLREVAQAYAMLADPAAVPPAIVGASSRRR